MPITSSMPQAVVASEPASGSWPAHRTAVIDWLMTETQGQRFIDNIMVEMCERLRADGIPLGRVTLHFRTHNPEWLGARLLWRPGLKEAEITTFDYDVIDTPQYLNSPMYELQSGAEEVRRRLDSDAPQPGRDYPIFHELRDEGLTDYISWPIQHTLGKRHSVSFAADRPGGFSGDDIDALADLLPAFALVSEIRLKNRLARTFLETYVGPHASEQILAGATTRGSGTTVDAAILICDIRDFTSISELWPRDDVLHLLNDYFDAMSDPIEKHGGEILKFMGDGLLAIFPMSNPNAAQNLLQAVVEARAAVTLLNEDHVRHGRKPLGYGVGVHVGDVMYGNIGSRKRLDFTVIGPAVNVASRLETLTKKVHRPVLLSSAFVAKAGCASMLESLGRFPLKGLGEPIEVFAFSAEPCDTVAGDVPIENAA